MAGKPPNSAEHHGEAVRRTFEVVVTKTEDGWYIGDVPSLPGAFTQGKTVQQVRDRIREAILLVLQDEEPLPTRFVSVETVDVEA